MLEKAANKQPIVSEYDMSIMNVLLSIKSDIDQKVYDRNDILKKDAYFERTVMTQIKAGIDKLGVASAREDRVFIQSRITKQYLDQYKPDLFSGIKENTMEETKTIKEKTIELIDALKATCQTYGMGNDGNEYKIITQVFLYKFLNDKFGYEVKKVSPVLKKC